MKERDPRLEIDNGPELTDPLFGGAADKPSTPRPPLEEADHIKGFVTDYGVKLGKVAFNEPTNPVFE